MYLSIAGLLLIHGMVLYGCIDWLVSYRLRNALELTRWQRRYDSDELLLDLLLVLQDAGIEPRVREAFGEVVRRRCFTHPSWMTESLTRHPHDESTDDEKTLVYRRSKLWSGLCQLFSSWTSVPDASRPSNAILQSWVEAETQMNRDAATAAKRPKKARDE